VDGGAREHVWHGDSARMSHCVVAHGPRRLPSWNPGQVSVPSVRVIGALNHLAGTEASRYRRDLRIDRDYIIESARVQDRAGFDATLIAVGVSSPDSVVIAGLAFAETERLGALIAYRPNSEPPSSAARRFATLAELWPERIVAVNVVSGASDADARREGESLTKSGRYERAGEWLQVFRQALGSEPFDFDGAHYRVTDGRSDIPSDRVRLYVGGHSESAVDIAGRWGDVYASWGAPLAYFTPRIEKVASVARDAGRRVGVSASFRPIVGRTEREAWEKAAAFEQQIRAESRGLVAPEHLPTIAGHDDLWRAADEALVHDERVWLGITGIPGARYDTTAVVGTAEQVADCLGRFADAGVTDFILRGFGVEVEEFAEWGHELIPRLHAR
jgi:alkanesulfonate monooxygenase